METDLLFVFLFLCGVAVANITEYKRVCYYASWTIYRNGVTKYSADNLTDLSICTHYIYSFAGVDPINKTIIPLDDIDEKGGYAKLTDIKKRDSNVKVLLALGGWSFGGEKFAVLSNSTDGIHEFCVNAVEYLRKWNFDGVDVDWEYPTERGGGPEDKENFVTLLETLRQRFENESKESGKPRLLLTSAVPILKNILDAGYDRKRIGEAVDFLNVMVYDLYGYSKTIGHHAPIYPRTSSSEIEQQLNAEWGLTYWAADVSKDKLIFGMPLYARTFSLYNSTMHHIGDPNNGTGSPGPYINVGGVLNHFEICTMINGGNLTEIWDEEQSVPYAYSETDWAGYDNERSAKSKANFVKDNQYGGIMIWELSADDFDGRFCKKGKYPIMNAIRDTLTGSREDCLPGTFGGLNSMGCSPCPTDTYQPETSKTSCIECPVGMVTQTEGSIKEYECIYPGEEITNYKRVCYYTSWAIKREGVTQYSADNLTDLSICTHYIYSFAGVDPINKTIIPLDDMDEIGGYSRLTSIKKRDPSVKVLLAVGGWNFGVEKFALLSNSTERIDEFCVNAIAYLRKWNFDGVDVDWEYPTERGGGPEDKENFARLLEKLRASFEAESKDIGKSRLLLTSAVPITQSTLDKGYDTTRIGRAVDFLNVMVYDLFGGWSKTIGHHAALYPRTEASESERQLNVQWGLTYWAADVSKEKLVLGMPLYARSFNLYNSSMNHQGDPSNGTGSPGPYIKNNGIYLYTEICTLVNRGDLTEEWNDEQSAPYAYSKTDWAGYDNARSIRSKANFVKDNQYGGLMVWELSYDDFSGRFCGNGKYPMMNAIKYSLTGSRENCKPGTYGYLNRMGCNSCPKHTYQPDSSQTSCMNCPMGMVTKTEYTVGEHDCILDCGAGWEFDYSTRTCVACHIGYYRIKPNSLFCIKCSTGFTTVSTGSGMNCVKMPEGSITKAVQHVDITAGLKVNTKYCNNKELLVNVVLSIAKEDMLMMSQTWSGICLKDCENIVLGKVMGCSNRKTRDSNENNEMTIEIIISGIPEEISDGVITRRSQMVISESFNRRQDFKKLDTYMLHYDGLKYITSVNVCTERNYVFYNGICVPCGKGSYYNSVTFICTPCVSAYYQDEEGADGCKPCPGLLTTKHEGSDNKNLCISQCDLNPGYCNQHGRCVGSDIGLMCECTTGFEGEYCEKLAETSEESSYSVHKLEILTVAFGTSIGFLLIVLIIIVVFVYRRFSRRSGQYKVSINEYDKK